MLLVFFRLFLDLLMFPITARHICLIFATHRFNIQVELGPDNIAQVHLEWSDKFISIQHISASTCLASIHCLVLWMNHSLWVAAVPGTLNSVVNVRLGGSPLWTPGVGFWRPASNSTILLIWSQKVGFKFKEFIAYQPDICMGLFPPVATLLVLSNQPT